MPTYAKSQAFRRAGRQTIRQIDRQAARQTAPGTRAADRSEKVAMNSLTSVTASSRLAMRVGLAARLALARTSPCSSAAQLTNASQLLAL